MKKVIDGIAYNTDTATLVASRQNDRCDVMVTRNGAWFLLKTDVRRQWNQKLKEHERREFTYLMPISSHDIVEHLEQGEWVLFDKQFAENGEKGTAICIRMSAALKRRIDKAASANGTTVQAFVRRLIEQHLSA